MPSCKGAASDLELLVDGGHIRACYHGSVLNLGVLYQIVYMKIQ